MKRLLLRYFLPILLLAVVSNDRAWGQVTFTKVTSGVTTSGSTIYNGQAMTLVGTKIRSTSAINFGGTTLLYFNTNVNSPQTGYFGSTLELWMSVGSATPTKVTTASFTQSGTELRASMGSTLVMTANTDYTFYIKGTVTRGGGVTFPTTFQIDLNRIFADCCGQLYINSITTTSATAMSFTFSNGTLTVTDNNSTANGITANTLLSYGQTGIVLFSFKVVGQGNYNLTGMKIPATSSVNQMFPNGTLYRSSDQYFDHASAIVGPTVDFNAGVSGAVITNLTESFVVDSARTYYYFLVADLTKTIFYSPASITFNFTSGQSASPAITTSLTTYNNITTTGGQTFTVVQNYDWKGALSSVWSNASNFELFNQGSTASSAPTSAISVFIGHEASTRIPTIGSTTFGALVFSNDASSSKTVNLSSGATVNIAGIIVNSGVDAIITASGPATINLTSTGLSRIASNSSLSIGSNITINNSGDFIIESSSSGTGSIREIPSSSSITGSVTVQRYISGGRNYRLMSFPVSGSSMTMGDRLLVPGTGYTALSYSPTTGKFTSISSSSAGNGFYFFFRGNDFTNTSTKTVKSGASYATAESVVALQKGTLYQQGYNMVLAKGYNLLGNPYASNITVSSTALGANATPFVYTYSPGGSSVTQNAMPYVVPSGHGFFINATDASTFAFTESMKTLTQGTLLMGTAPTTPEGNIKLQLYKDSANYDQTQLRFLNSYNKNYDVMEDADDFNGPIQTVFFGSMTADQHLVGIASQPIDKVRTSVFLSATGTTSGTYKIKRIDLSNIPDKFDVILHDHFTKDSVDLRKDSVYSFTMDKLNAATFGNTRFEIVLRKKILPPYALLSFSGKKYAGNSVIKWTTRNEYTFTEFALERSFDGKNYEGVANVQSTGTGSYGFTDNSTNGMVYYRLKQTDINDNVTYSNAIILLTADTDSDVFSVYPNPTDGVLKFSLSYPVKNKVTLKIYNTMGRSISSTIFDNGNGEKDVSGLVPGNYIVNLVDNGTGKIIAKTKFIKL